MPLRRPHNGQVSEQRSRGNPRFADMLRSVLLVVVLVLLLWGFSELSDTEREPPVRVVDYSGQLSAARDAADYGVLAPSGLGPAWRATSVELQTSGDAVRWHLGMLTPQDEYVGLEQYDGESATLAAEHLDGLRRAGRTRIDNVTWEIWTGEVDDALVRRDAGVTTVVVGTASPDTLERFTAALTPGHSASS